MSLSKIAKSIAKRSHYLSTEEAVCYICAQAAIEGAVYGTKLVKDLNGSSSESVDLRMSETILTKAIAVLEKEGVMSRSQLKLPGRGRPREMMEIRATNGVKECAEAWDLFLSRLT